MSYYSTGGKHTEGDFEKGQPHGTVKRYRKNGALQYEGTMINAMFDFGVLFRNDGTIYFKGQFLDGNPSHGSWFNGKNVTVFTGSSFDFNQSLGRNILSHLCTFGMTSTTHVLQQWFNCSTCFGDSHAKGVCLACSKRCHKGHTLIDRGVSAFFCDCGSGEYGIMCIADEPCEPGCGCD